MCLKSTRHPFDSDWVHKNINTGFVMVKKLFCYCCCCVFGAASVFAQSWTHTIKEADEFLGTKGTEYYGYMENGNGSVLFSDDGQSIGMIISTEKGIFDYDISRKEVATRLGFYRRDTLVCSVRLPAGDYASFCVSSKSANCIVKFSKLKRYENWCSNRDDVRAVKAIEAGEIHKMGMWDVLIPAMLDWLKFEGSIRFYIPTVKSVFDITLPQIDQGSLMEVES